MILPRKSSMFHACCGRHPVSRFRRPRSPVVAVEAQRQEDFSARCRLKALPKQDCSLMYIKCLHST